MSNEFFGLLASALAITSFALVVAIITVAMRSKFPRLSGRVSDLRAVQSMHTQLTPRVGGVAVFGALCAGVIFVPASILGMYVNLMVAASLIFVVGLAEDLGFGVSPGKRLLAVMVSSLLLILLSGVWLPRTGILALDLVLDHWAIGVPLTILVTAGLANGFNLIDGVNGLSSVVTLGAAVGMSQIAQATGDSAIAHLALLLAAGVVGFFVLNYPFGWIFLGDAGAYTIGFVLSWVGIFILFNSSDVSPWAILLTVFWPAADTSLAIYRRYRCKRAISAPDRLHVHQIVMRTLEICLLGNKRRGVSNPLTTLVLSPFVLAPPIVGVLLWDQNTNAFWAVLVFAVLFFGSYVAIPSLVRQFRLRAVNASNFRMFEVSA